VKDIVYITVYFTMKANWLIIVSVILLGSALKIGGVLSFDNAAITIKDVNVIESYSGKLLCYTINLYSPSQIKDFVAIPNIDGANIDSKTTFEFNNHTRRATVVYYYALPQHADEKDISIRFCLNNDDYQTDNIVCSIYQEM